MVAQSTKARRRKLRAERLARFRELGERFLVVDDPQQQRAARAVRYVCNRGHTRNPRGVSTLTNPRHAPPGHIAAPKALAPSPSSNSSMVI
jgi:hypothetical protein